MVKTWSMKFNTEADLIHPETGNKTKLYLVEKDDHYEWIHEYDGDTMVTGDTVADAISAAEDTRADWDLRISR